MKIITKQKGFAVVLMVMVVSAVSLSVSLLLSEQSLFSNTTTKITTSRQMSLYAAEACVERALLVVRDDNNYEGTLNYTIGETDCVVTVTDQGGQERRLEASATNNEVTANLLITTSELSPQLTATWIDAKSF